jgi:hypothetical protein
MSTAGVDALWGCCPGSCSLAVLFKRPIGAFVAPATLKGTLIACTKEGKIQFIPPTKRKAEIIFFTKNLQKKLKNYKK